MAKLTIVEEKPVPPPKKYVLEMTEDEAKCLGDILAFVSACRGPLYELYVAVRDVIPYRPVVSVRITDTKKIVSI